DGLGDFVDYITAIGDDPFSAEMAAFWSAQGVGHSHVLRRAGKRPGLYFIKLDANGERRFYYWRGEAAVRDCFETEGSDELLASLGGFTHIYLSGITLAVLRPASRERLLSRLEQLARSGTTIVFDCNHRPLLWESPQTAGTFAARMARMATHLLLTVEERAVVGVAPAAAAGGRPWCRACMSSTWSTPPLPAIPSVPPTCSAARSASIRRRARGARTWWPLPSSSTTAPSSRKTQHLPCSRRSSPRSGQRRTEAKGGDHADQESGR